MFNKIRAFIRLEVAGGAVLFAATLLAIIISNSGWSAYYHTWVAAPLTITFNHIGLSKPLVLWINEGLMAIFFCLVSLEIKREICIGELKAVSQRRLPAIAAIGGMLVPALIFYVCVQPLGPQAVQGWAIPTATDIAFSLGVLALLGKRIPFQLKILLMAIAIFDDLAGILIIAVYYTAQISWPLLLGATICCIALWLLNRRHVQSLFAYVVVGLILWLCVLKSGVHATLAGVILAVALPLKPDGTSLAVQVEDKLHPWVAFCVVPLFALANAGIDLSKVQPAAWLMPIPMGIFLGLFVGKQVGICTAIWLAELCGVAYRPTGLTWTAIWGMALVCGIGFTMSLFLGTLAYDDPNSQWQGMVRLGVFVGSILSGGWVQLY